MANYVLVSAKAESGKDEVGKILKPLLEKGNSKAYIVGYGDHVKEIARQFYNWDGEKNTKGRALLQRIGSSYGKIKSHNNLYFVEHLITLSQYLLDEDDYVLITDARYPFEIDFVKENLRKEDTIHSIRIHRPNHISKLTKEQLKHESETSLDDYKDFDYHIINTTLEELNRSVKVIHADIVNSVKKQNRRKLND